MRKEGGLVYLTAGEMAEADRMAIEDYGIDVIALMENAGVATAQLAKKMLGGDVRGKNVWCLVGRGNNGGDGLVAARHLNNWGAGVRVILAGKRSDLRDIPAKQIATVDKMGISVVSTGEGLGDAHLVVDALLGYGSRGSPREPVAGLIRLANASKVPILAVDIPSGMDATSGELGDPTVEARATVTFGLPKTGFLNPKARPYVGELYLADISMPGRIYASHSAGSGIFSKESLVRIW
ncbi:MAG TPA: NAD(P)H-hydrate epimerase [Nitrososphaerales archaeon]|nr:NAD(P)H-hydrate epimerase [Nitrososphaerales archaeon]